MIPPRHRIEAQNPGERHIILAAGADNREIWLNLRIRAAHSAVKRYRIHCKHSMNTNLKTLAVAVLALAGASQAWGEIDLAYYSSLNGLSGEKLKNAIHTLVTTDVKIYSYGSGKNKTWWWFYETDRDESNNSVIDRYSPDVRYFGSRGDAVSGMNIEHSFPKSWWGGSSNNAYKDLYNLMPSESKINGLKSNYAMGLVVSGSGGNGFTKIGTGPDGFMVWEPADEWKGAFARGYMYMATAYQDFTWSGEGLKSLTTGDYPTLQPWASELYMEWARQYKVDEIEVTRNERVGALQNNRNPYVDFPNLMEYVWGDSIGKAFDPLVSVKSTKFTGTPDEPTDALIDANFQAETGEFTVVNEVKPSSISSVWSRNASYGWVGKGATGTGATLVKHATDATLYSPEVDLTSRRAAALTFEHALNFCTDHAKYVSVSVIDVATDVATPLTVPTWPSGKNWTFVQSGSVDLTPYCGKTIKLAFRYTSDTDVAGTWEIKTLKLTAVGKTGGVETVPVYLQPDEKDSTLPVEYYSIDGRRINPEGYHGIAIRRQGSKTTKIRL